MFEIHKTQFWRIINSVNYIEKVILLNSKQLNERNVIHNTLLIHKKTNMLYLVTTF